MINIDDTESHPLIINIYEAEKQALIVVKKKFDTNGWNFWRPKHKASDNYVYRFNSKLSDNNTYWIVIVTCTCIYSCTFKSIKKTVIIYNSTDPLYVLGDYIIDPNCLKM